MKPRRQGPPPRPKIGAVQLDVLDSIAAGVREIPTLAEHTGRPYLLVFKALRGLERRGFVVRVRRREWGGPPGCGPGAYALTPYGRAQMSLALQAGRVPGVRVRR